jgi:hypothetical protein
MERMLGMMLTLPSTLQEADLWVSSSLVMGWHTAFFTHSALDGSICSSKVANQGPLELVNDGLPILILHLLN